MEGSAGASAPPSFLHRATVAACALRGQATTPAGSLNWAVAGGGGAFVLIGTASGTAPPTLCSFAGEDRRSVGRGLETLRDAAEEFRGVLVKVGHEAAPQGQARPRRHPPESPRSAADDAARSAASLPTTSGHFWALSLLRGASQLVAQRHSVSHYGSLNA